MGKGFIQTARELMNPKLRTETNRGKAIKKQINEAKEGKGKGKVSKKKKDEGWSWG